MRIVEFSSVATEEDHNKSPSGCEPEIKNGTGICYVHVQSRNKHVEYTLLQAFRVQNRVDIFGFDFREL